MAPALHRLMPISPQHKFYIDRAASAKAEAEAATLDNVRDRCRRSEDAWNQLADRAARTDQRRTDAAAASASAASPADGEQPTE